MAPYPLNLPVQLQQAAEKLAAKQGITLDRFILWAVAEKIGALSQPADDPAFPNVTYRRGASGEPVPVLRGTALPVQTVAVAATQWGLSPNQIAAEYDISETLVNDAKVEK